MRGRRAPLARGILAGQTFTQGKIACRYRSGRIGPYCPGYSSIIVVDGFRVRLATVIARCAVAIGVFLLRARSTAQIPVEVRMRLLEIADDLEVDPLHLGPNGSFIMLTVVASPIIIAVSYVFYVLAEKPFTSATIKRAAA